MFKMHPKLSDYSTVMATQDLKIREKTQGLPRVKRIIADTYINLEPKKRESKKRLWSYSWFLGILETFFFKYVNNAI
jgi:hypothetical protein